MGLRSTGNPDTSNPVAMSMLEYLRKKGIEAMEMTNGERIRNMSDEELAKFISVQFCHGYGEPQILEWLKQPVED